MEEIIRNIVNVLYYLYFENRELVYHFERVWTEDGMSYKDDEYSYIFYSVGQHFAVDLETYYFLFNNDIIEETSGSEYDSVYELTPYYRTWLTNLLKERNKKRKTTHVIFVNKK